VSAEPDIGEFERAQESSLVEQELRRQLRSLELKYRRAKAKSAELVEAVYQAAKDAAVIQGNPPAVPKPKVDRRQKRAEAALLLLSDWHVGKHTPSFNTDVAANRVQLLGEKTVKITEIERADHPVRDCHCLLTGDMVENVAIFPGQPFEVDSTTFQQVFACASSLEGLLRHLLSTFQTVHVWEQIGNHGRLGRKGDYPRSDNVDLIVYRLAKERLSGLEASGRLVWHPWESWFTLVEIGAYRALQIHGDQIKSFGGNVPAYGISRKANAWASGVLGVEFTDVMLGHFHSPMSLPLANGKGRAFVNPSIESDSAFAQEFVAATGTPGQRLFYVDPDRGRITSERVIWLDDH
jgi:hypothetical protein